jgi:putative sterol carrier protein
MADIVECRSESEYAEQPIALTWEGQRLEIEEIVTRWRTPGEKRFRVLTSGGQAFELAYRLGDDEWRVHLL